MCDAARIECKNARPGQSDRSARQSLNKKQEPKGINLVPSARQFFDGLPC